MRRGFSLGPGKGIARASKCAQVELLSNETFIQRIESMWTFPRFASLKPFSKYDIRSDSRELELCPFISHYERDGLETFHLQAPLPLTLWKSVSFRNVM